MQSVQPCLGFDTQAEEAAVVVLVPMSAAAFAGYVEAAVAGYVEDNVASGRWPEEGALARSRTDFDASLPQGLQTPGNYLLEIRIAATGLTVGSIWFAVQEKHGLRTAFVHDVEVRPEYRRQGHVTAAFQALEPLVRDLGLPSIGLLCSVTTRGRRPCTASSGTRSPGSTCRSDFAPRTDSRPSPDALHSLDTRPVLA